jgi:hypothetical protein
MVDADCVETGYHNAGYHKFRWKIVSCDMEKTGEMLEQVRSQYENVLVLGDRDCYQLCGD